MANEPDFTYTNFIAQRNQLEKLHNDFQQAQDEIEFLTKRNDTLWKVVQILTENI